MMDIEVTIEENVDPAVKKAVFGLIEDPEFMRLVRGVRSIGSSYVAVFTKRSHKSVDRAISRAKLLVSGQVDVKDHVFDWGIKVTKFPISK